MTPQRPERCVETRHGAMALLITSIGMATKALNVFIHECVSVQWPFSERFRQRMHEELGASAIIVVWTVSNYIESNYAG